MENQEKVIIGEGGKSLLAMADKMETMMKAITVARQVKAKLKELGWTNKQLAEAMGCSQPMVTKIVRGDQNLTLETISKLERVLGIKEIYLHKHESRPVVVNKVMLAVTPPIAYMMPASTRTMADGLFQQRSLPAKTSFSNIIATTCDA